MLVLHLSKARRRRGCGGRGARACMVHARTEPVCLRASEAGGGGGRGGQVGQVRVTSAGVERL